MQNLALLQTLQKGGEAKLVIPAHALSLSEIFVDL
jgi:hypothetical protein